MNGYKQVTTTQEEPGSEQRVVAIKVTQVIWLLLGLLEAVLALRFVFKLIMANPANPFATLLYNVSGFFLAPFANLVASPVLGGAVVEFSTLIAMLIYLLIAWALVEIIDILFYRPRSPVNTRQTIVSDSNSTQAPVGMNQTRTIERTTTQTPSGDSQTTETETKTQTPQSH